MIKYANYLIIIFMDINETLEMRENYRKMGDIYKTTPISAAINYKFPNLESLNNFVLFYYLVSKLSNF